jgi:hypothetical protein
LEFDRAGDGEYIDRQRRSLRVMTTPGRDLNDPVAVPPQRAKSVSDMIKRKFELTVLGKVVYLIGILSLGTIGFGVVAWYFYHAAALFWMTLPFGLAGLAVAALLLIIFRKKGLLK